MAAKVPATLTELRAAPTSGSYVNPETGGGVSGGFSIIGPNVDYRSLKHRVFFFENIDNGDTWTSGIPGPIEVCAWDWNTTATVLATAAGTGVVTFTTSADNLAIVLHVWSNGG